MKFYCAQAAHTDKRVPLCYQKGLITCNCTQTKAMGRRESKQLYLPRHYFH